MVAVESAVAVEVIELMLSVTIVTVSDWLAVALAPLLSVAVTRIPMVPLIPASGYVPVSGVADDVSSDQLPLPFVATE